MINTTVNVPSKVGSKDYIELTLSLTDMLVKQLKEELSKRNVGLAKVIEVLGPSSSGKSTLVSQMIHTHTRTLPCTDIVWVDCGDVSMLNQSLDTIIHADKFNKYVTSTPCPWSESLQQLVKAFIKRTSDYPNERWLIVLDQLSVLPAELIETCQQLLKAGVQVLYTTCDTLLPAFKEDMIEGVSFEIAPLSRQIITDKVNPWLKQRLASAPLPTNLAATLMAHTEGLVGALATLCQLCVCVAQHTPDNLTTFWKMLQQGQDLSVPDYHKVLQPVLVSAVHQVLVSSGELDISSYATIQHLLMCCAYGAKGGRDTVSLSTSLLQAVLVKSEMPTSLAAQPSNKVPCLSEILQPLVHANLIHMDQYRVTLLTPLQRALQTVLECHWEDVVTQAKAVNKNTHNNELKQRLGHIITLLQSFNIHYLITDRLPEDAQSQQALHKRHQTILPFVAYLLDVYIWPARMESVHRGQLQQLPLEAVKVLAVVVASVGLYYYRDVQQLRTALCYLNNGRELLEEHLDEVWLVHFTHKPKRSDSGKVKILQDETFTEAHKELMLHYACDYLGIISRIQSQLTQGNDGDFDTHLITQLQSAYNIQQQLLGNTPSLNKLYTLRSLIRAEKKEQRLRQERPRLSDEIHLKFQALLEQAKDFIKSVGVPNKKNFHDMQLDFQLDAIYYEKQSMDTLLDEQPEGSVNYSSILEQFTQLEADYSSAQRITKDVLPLLFYAAETHLAQSQLKMLSERQCKQAFVNSVKRYLRILHECYTSLKGQARQQQRWYARVLDALGDAYRQYGLYALADNYLTRASDAQCALLGKESHYHRKTQDKRAVNRVFLDKALKELATTPTPLTQLAQYEQIRNKADYVYGQILQDLNTEQLTEDRMQIYNTLLLNEIKTVKNNQSLVAQEEAQQRLNTAIQRENQYQRRKDKLLSTQQRQWYQQFAIDHPIHKESLQFLFKCSLSVLLLDKLLKYALKAGGKEKGLSQTAIGIGISQACAQLIPKIQVSQTTGIAASINPRGVVTGLLDIYGQYHKGKKDTETQRIQTFLKQTEDTDTLQQKILSCVITMAEYATRCYALQLEAFQDEDTQQEDVTTLAQNGAQRILNYLKHKRKTESYEEAVIQGLQYGKSQDKRLKQRDESGRHWRVQEVFTCPYLFCPEANTTTEQDKYYLNKKHLDQYKPKIYGYRYASLVEVSQSNYVSLPSKEVVIQKVIAAKEKVKEDAHRCAVM